MDDALLVRVLDGVAGRHVLAKVQGFANYLYMVDAERHASLCGKASDVLARYGFKPEIRHRKKIPATPPPMTGGPPPLPDKEKPGGFWKRLFGGFGRNVP